MTVSEARAALPRILELVIDGDEVALTRHGETVAIIVRPDVLRTRRASPALDAVGVISAVLDRGRASRLDSGPSLNRDQAAAMAADVRTSRSQR